MFLNLTDFSDEPLQSQISRQIRAKVLNGEVDAGTMLPSIRKLARDQHVSVITVQRAYEALEREGLISSRRGKGFFVNEIRDKRKKEMSIEKLIDKIRPLLKVAKEEGLSIEDIFAVIKKVLESK
ncbi:MAG: GntR family transcriptional regulator [Melioribacteraceae bacterium]|nr:GntR family transcriptional regulator [Melioribacteraceae bacterium]